MPATFLGVRHHSPACARLVAEAVEELRPAFVLVEGPADFNDRLDELLLGHELPVAVFSHYRDGQRAVSSWTPLCDYSPEWVAVSSGRAAGAEVRFIDLPAWHPAFAERTNRYAEATARLCRHFSVDSVDALWDRLFETEDGDASGDGGGDGPGAGSGDGTARRLEAYFDLVRGEAKADAGDRAREEYMAAWVRAALREAGERPVLVVTGGFHTPALRALAALPEPCGDSTAEDGGPGPEGGGRAAGGGGWPGVPAPPEGALAGSFLVPYSFRRMDAFTGYQSGMPSPGYYQQVWEHGPREAADRLLRAAAERLRARSLPVSTADLIAARTRARGLAALRGHPHPTRLDVLDGLAGALVSEALDQPLPWTRRGPLAAGTHPVVAEMLAVCGGTGEGPEGGWGRTGRLHPGTPAPPLVHDVAAQLERLGLDGGEPVRLDLTDARDLERSRVLHRLRLLGVPGAVRTAGPAHGADPVFEERWEPGSRQGREAALVEAGAFGATLEDAAAAALGERAEDAGPQADRLAGILFDAVLSGAGELSERLVAVLADGVRELHDTAALGEVLATALGLWRHDRVYGVARGPMLAAAIDGAVSRVLWLVEGVRAGAGAVAPGDPAGFGDPGGGGGGGPSGGGPGGGVDLGRLRAVVAVRDALLHAGPLSAVTPEAAAASARRIARDPHAPADLRGAATGLARVLDGPGGAVDHGAAVRAAGDPRTLGDWLTGLFAVAREEVTAPDSGAGDGSESLLDALDGIVTAMSGADFLTGLPALRQAFAFFPPRERERVAQRLLERRGLRGSARPLLRTTADPLQIARAKSLEENVVRLLDRYGLRGAR
ncbi:DUF5682 family protein [Streptomyces thermolineatus]|uniref:DUF5682 family protein n=1 Tax=Streptomyces thermolineatus TaxID=44033 RepID=UPI0038517FE5